MARKLQHAPKPGRLEHNVDSILLGQGLELNSSVERILGKSRRSRFVPFKKSPKKAGRKKAKATKRPKRAKAARSRPARGKRLRAARRKGPGK